MVTIDPGKSSRVKDQFGQYYYTVKKVYMDLERGLVKAIFAKSPVIAGSRFYYEYLGTRDLHIYSKIEKKGLIVMSI
jgi:hypothetical protein